MSPLTINFNQFIDLTINPSYGTINPTLLHTLLHLIIDQLKMSSCLVEFHGNGCELIENQILCNKSYQCELKVKRYEIKQEIDDEVDTSSESGKIEKQNRIEIIEDGIGDDMTKLFTVTDISEPNSYPIGYPINPIQPISIDDFKKLELKVESIHDVVASAMPTDSTIIRETDSKSNRMKDLIDLVNATKRIDALEMGIRQLAEAIKEIPCEKVKSEESMKSQSYTVRDSDDSKRDTIWSDLSENFAEQLEQAQNKLHELEDRIDNIYCKCSEEGYESLLFERFHSQIMTELGDQSNSVHEDIEGIKTAHHSQFSQLTTELDDYKKSIASILQKHEGDLISSLRDVQKILNTKLNKADVGVLKNFVRETLKGVEDKIENIDCQRALAAGVTEKCFRDVNCLSCSERVIQIDDPMTSKTQLLSKGFTKKSTTDIDNHKFDLHQLTTRLCGGNHTIISPKERVFRPASIKHKNFFEK